MFTGLIDAIGRVESVTPLSHNERKITILSSYHNLSHGESIAINGVCLTVTECDQKRFQVYASCETLGRTNLGSLRAESYVNLERSLRIDSFVGGHLVMGHIDETTKIVSLIKKGDSINVESLVTEKIKNVLIEKGSIALNGVSLTINEVSTHSFHVNLIPTTLEKTTFKASRVGDLVNVEIDVIARYVQGYLQNIGYHYEKNRTCP